MRNASEPFVRGPNWCLHEFRLMRALLVPATVWVAALLAAGGCAHGAPPAGGAGAAPATRSAHAPDRDEPFILGADISWIPEDEAAGATYFDGGVRKDVFEILKQHKFNWVRLRVFVDPAGPRGYAARQPEAFCDLPHTAAMARRAKAAGMKVLIDFHYSDTWASPGHQNKPAAWANLSFPDLTKAVHDHTFKVVSTLRVQGTPADMVQIGNEVTDGVLFPDGSKSNWDGFAALLRAGTDAAREADPDVRVMLHHHMGRSNAVMRVWLDNLIERGVNFDVIGMSCYAQAKEGDWKANFDDLATRYPDKRLIAAEYSPKKQQVNDLIYNAPNHRGLGTFIWEPTRHLEALFDKNGVNAGGGGRTNDLGQVQNGPGAANPRPATRPEANASVPASRPTTFPTTRRGPRRNGGRYDTNDFINLYPELSKRYGNE